jgi:hypothetical protein
MFLIEKKISFDFLYDARCFVGNTRKNVLPFLGKRSQ